MISGQIHADPFTFGTCWDKKMIFFEKKKKQKKAAFCNFRETLIFTPTFQNFYKTLYYKFTETCSSEEKERYYNYVLAG